MGTALPLTGGDASPSSARPSPIARGKACCLPSCQSCLQPLLEGSVQDQRVAARVHRRHVIPLQLLGDCDGQPAGGAGRAQPLSVQVHTPASALAVPGVRLGEPGGQRVHGQRAPDRCEEPAEHHVLRHRAQQPAGATRVRPLCVLPGAFALPEHGKAAAGGAVERGQEGGGLRLKEAAEGGGLHPDRS